MAEIERIRRIGIPIELDHRVDGDEVRTMLGDVRRGVPGHRSGSDRAALDRGRRTWKGSGRRSISSSRPTPGRSPSASSGTDVVVIGAGNTAIDVATAAVRLGAGTVTIAYRRSEALIPAFDYEYRLARADGIRFEWFAQPVRILGEGGKDRGRRVPPDRARRPGFDGPAGSGRCPAPNFSFRADMVVKALGQEPMVDLLAALPGLRSDAGGSSSIVTPARRASPGCLPAATACATAARSSMRSRMARSRRAASDAAITRISG